MLRKEVHMVHVLYDYGLVGIAVIGVIAFVAGIVILNTVHKPKGIIPKGLVWFAEAVAMVIIGMIMLVLIYSWKLKRRIPGWLRRIRGQ